MARKRDRIFALSLALLFFFTAFGFSFYVIWQAVSSKSSSNNASNQQTCTVTSVANTTTLPAPAIYAPGPVASLQTTDLAVGSGAAVKSGDCLVAKYYGTLATTGAVFDENFDKPTALTFPLGQGQVIKGWDEGIIGMKIGGMRRLVIPPSLGYGSQPKTDPTTNQVTIPANSTLVFVIKLLSIQSS